MLERLEKILKEEEMKKIKNLRLLIVGIGGVGGYALESLVRMGVSYITIIDNDKIEETNLNRQILALSSTLGKPKVEVAEKRYKDIFPSLNIKAKNAFLTSENIEDLLDEPYDFIIDACDTISTKIALIKYANEHHINIISCMGTGNRINPTMLEITTLEKTQNDPLAKVMRKLVKENNLDKKTPVISSKELPIKIHDRTPGSSALVPSTAGIYAAYFVIHETLKDNH